MVHFEQDLREEEVREVAKILSQPAEFHHSMVSGWCTSITLFLSFAVQDPVLGSVSQANCLPSRTPEHLEAKEKSFPQLHV